MQHRTHTARWTPVLAPRRSRCARLVVWLTSIALLRFVLMPVTAWMLAVSCWLGAVVRWSGKE